MRLPQLPPALARILPARAELTHPLQRPSAPRVSRFVAPRSPDAGASASVVQRALAALRELVARLRAALVGPAHPEAPVLAAGAPVAERGVNILRAEGTASRAGAPVAAHDGAPLVGGAASRAGAPVAARDGAPLVGGAASQASAPVAAHDGAPLVGGAASQASAQVTAGAARESAPGAEGAASASVVEGAARENAPGAVSAASRASPASNGVASSDAPVAKRRTRASAPVERGSSRSRGSDGAPGGPAPRAATGTFGLGEAAEADGALAQLRQGTVGKEQVAEVQGDALAQLAAAFPHPADAAFREALRAEHASAPVRPIPEGLAAQHAARAEVAETFLRLHEQGLAPLAPAVLARCVEQFGDVCSPEGAPLLQTLQRNATAAGDVPTAQAAAKALQKLALMDRPRVALAQMEQGRFGTGGVGTYVNSGIQALAEEGFRVESYAPVPGNASRAQEAVGKPVPGSAGSVDIGGRLVRFHLTAKEGPVMAKGGQVVEYYIFDDGYFTHRSLATTPHSKDSQARFPDSNVIYEPDSVPYEQRALRLFAGGALVNAAMSKVAALRKVGDVSGLSPEEATAAVTAAEQTLTREDAPRFIQYNDPHLVSSYPLLHANEAFQGSVPVGIIHNASRGYHPWVPMHLLKEVLEKSLPAGHPMRARLEGRDAVDLFEVMVALMTTGTVSEGYLRRKLSEGVEGFQEAEFQEYLRLAFARGRAVANPNPMPAKEGVTHANVDGLKAAAKHALQARAAARGGEHIPVDPSASVLAFVGRFSSQKGIRELLAPDLHGVTPLDEVLRRAQEEGLNVQLVLKGPVVEGDLKAPLLALKQRWPQHVELEMERVNADDVMLAADVFLAVSREEPFGLTPLEAGRAGASVVVSNVDELPKIVPAYDAAKGTGCGVHVDLQDRESLVDGVLNALRLSRDPKAGPQLRHNAIDNVQRYDPATWAKNQRALYRTALNHFEGPLPEAGPSSKPLWT